jgi:hypothetical protein
LQAPVIEHVDIMQLALNSSSAYTAEAAMRVLPQWCLEPHQARQLLLTAAANKHAGQLLDAVLLCDEVQQHIDAATAEAVIELLLAHEMKWPCKRASPVAGLWSSVRNLL